MIELNIASLNRGNLAAHIEEILKHISTVNKDDFEDVWQYNIRLSLWEIFANIIQYEETSPIKAVTVKVLDEKHCLTIQIDSRSHGFSWLEHTGKHCPPVDQEGGRGFFIIEQITDEFLYDESGRMATLKFYRKEKH